jgi:DNA gyrase inhibitor GyrI
MEKQEIRIINLPPMRIASFYAFSASPELEAWKKTVAWAKAHECLQEHPSQRIFGFDNPSPSAGSPNYGYEFWLTIGPDMQLDSQTQVKEFSGGLYGVLLCDVTEADPYVIIPSTWGKLVKWLEASHYNHGNHQWLEEHLTRFNSNGRGFILDLYLPITE